MKYFVFKKENRVAAVGHRRMRIYYTLKFANRDLSVSINCWVEQDGGLY